MCLLIALHKVRPAAPLIVAANRDELFARPARTMTVLQPAAPRILGGRDLLAGGTWLALNEHGVVAALTNAYGGAAREPGRKTRGLLPLLLAQHETAAAAAEAFLASVDPADYNPCWMLWGDREQLFYLELQAERPLQAALLPPGVHVLENHALQPVSVKAAFVRERVEAALASGGPLVPALHAVLASHAVPPEVLSAADSAAYAKRSATMYAACVHAPINGTRTAAIIQVPAALPQTPELVFTDGAPCTHPLQSGGTLWWTADTAS